MKSFICEVCEKSFTVKSNLTRHMKSIHSNTKFECAKCSSKFSRKDHLEFHQKMMLGACRSDISKRNISVPTLTTSSPTTTTTIPSEPSSSSAPPSTAAPPSTTATTTTTTSPSVLPLSSSAPSTTSTTSSTTTPKPSSQETIFCSTCQKNFEKKHWMYHQRTNEHKRNSGVSSNGSFKLLKNGFKHRISSHYYENKNENELRGDYVLEEAHKAIFTLLEEKLHEHTAIKFNMELFGEYIKMTEETAIIDIKSHQTKMKPLFDKTTINDILEDMYYDILVKMSEFQERDSGWALIKILHLEININKYQPLRGSNYIRLPTHLLNKRACINVQNNDEFCFKWALISSLKAVNHEERCSSYNISNIGDDLIILDDANVILDFSNLTFPLSISDIKKFEKQNNTISINVFGYDDVLKKVVGPYYITQEEKVHHKNLLLLQEEDRFHYVWIKDISR